jgi:hypothetical protein
MRTGAFSAICLRRQNLYVGGGFCGSGRKIRKRIVKGRCIKNEMKMECGQALRR